MYSSGRRHGDDAQHDVEYRSGMFIRCDADDDDGPVELPVEGSVTCGFRSENGL